MALSKLVFKPGINREGTNYSNEGGWHDGDKIRFRYGYPEKMGGWVKVNSSVFAGTPRRLHDFVTLSSQSLLFIATEKKVYLEESGTLYDITPYRRTVALPYEFASPGVEAITATGSVAVLIGGTALTNLALVSGVAAHATIGDVASVTVSTPYSTALGHRLRSVQSRL